MTHSLDLPFRPKALRPGPASQGGSAPDGGRLGLNNYYFEKNGSPFPFVAGEYHYTRAWPEFWEEGLAKMKAGGINLVSTYVFWNHHEEVEGQFDWTGRRDLRAFLELCARQGLWAIVRLGPFCHGEVRNGGVPDWVYGQPWEARSNDEGYLALVRRLYGQIGAQLQGLLFQQGGPVVGLQIENEYQHSAAPWEAVSGTTKEWLPGGRDGRDHMLKLKQLARQAGMDAPFWTATAWGGACVPLPEALPLWGGYAYQPWLFYGDVKEHPATPEYLFRDHHSNRRPKTYNFAPDYAPEDYPYSCCEMGGGMQVWYPYRFLVDPQSVEAMAVVKTAGGCNFLGYYMYHGGTNPVGRVNPFLNEQTCPKLSYDFQAPLGEWGQARPHFHRLRLWHLLLETWKDTLLPLPTVLPSGAEEIDPLDRSAVRWSVRSDGRRGLMFVNNYQDHDQRLGLKELSWTLNTDQGPVRFPPEGTVGIAAGESAALPFGWPLGSLEVAAATAQPVTEIDAEGSRLWLFLAPEGMDPVFRLRGTPGGETLLHPVLGEPTPIRAADGTVETILVLSKAEAMRCQRVDFGGRSVLVRTDALVFPAAGTGGFCLEAEDDGPVEFSTIPALHRPGVAGAQLTGLGRDGLWTHYRADLPARPAAGRELEVIRHTDRKATVRPAPDALEGLRDLRIRVEYEGDVGNAFVAGTLVGDHFADGAPWDLSLARIDPKVFDAGLVLDIVPIRAGGRVVHDTTMAGRLEEGMRQVGSLRAVTAVPVRQVTLRPEL